MLPSKCRFIWPSSFIEFVFRTWPLRNKNCLWLPCLLKDQDEMSNLYRGPPIDDSYQISVRLTKRFQEKIFFFFFLEIDEPETRIACGGHVC
jgi:hypothetical protein